MKQITKLENLEATVKVPGSKSYTQRALIIASLADGESILRHALISEDIHLLVDALRSLGAVISVCDTDIRVLGTTGTIRNPRRALRLGNNGTALRFLTTLAALAKGEVILDGGPRLRQRPLQPLLDALQGLGVPCRSMDGNGCPPVAVEGGGFRGGRAVFTDSRSSQYISSLLIGAPYARKDVTVELRGETASLPYIEMTTALMRDFGVDVAKSGDRAYMIRAGQRYAGHEYAVEGDASSASYFFLAAALCRGRVRVQNINPDTLQGDIGFLGILERMGCSILKGKNWVEVTGGSLPAGDFRFDMGAMPDMVPTLAVLAAFRRGKTVISHIPHLRLKESDRIGALATELNRIGIDAAERDDGLVITGGIPRGARIETYDDHRIAMSFAVAGLAAGGIEIENETCVGKSFPGFWKELERFSS